MKIARTFKIGPYEIHLAVRKRHYYEIISGYTGDVVGWTSGYESLEEAQAEIREEEPRASLREITEEEWRAATED